MSTLQQSSLEVDIESASCNDGGGVGGGGDGGAVTEGGGAQLPSDANEIVRLDKTEKDERRESSVSVEILDLESGPIDSNLHLNLAKIERDCRICYLSMDSTNQDCGLPIELGCSCKDDLAAAHKQCAEAWFKIKGNKTCEICGSIAQNVAGIYSTEPIELSNDETNEGPTTARSSPPASESRNFWQGHRFLNFLLACMVFAFVISWLFHFNVPS